MNKQTNFDIDPELLAAFLDEAEESFAAMEGLFVELESDPNNTVTINAIYRPIHTLKGNSAFFGLTKVKTLAHELETILALAREKKLFPGRNTINLLLEGTDQLKKMLGRIRSGHAEIESEDEYRLLINRVIAAQTTTPATDTWQKLNAKIEALRHELEKTSPSAMPALGDLAELVNLFKTGSSGTGGTAAISTLNSLGNTTTTQKTEEPNTAASGRTEDTGKSAEQNRKTIRVAEESVDIFLNYVGELIVIGEMYSHLQKTLEEHLSDSTLGTRFKHVNESFTLLSDHLLKSVMSIRRVSVKSLLQKAPRIVRDVAADSGKNIKVELAGENTEIDKRLIEILDAPLTHIIRNAADHGIESSRQREEAGKPQHGIVRIEFRESPEFITLIISDDGRGLNLEAIRQKAIQLGLIQANQTLTQEQLVDLIFCSGVSTAEKVTDVSGRGVGMDVVRRNIDTANGKITIDTLPGRGTTFSISLPKTIMTQIIDGFLIGISDHCYVLPLDKVYEVFKPAPADISTITGKGQCVRRHQNLLPVVHLPKLLNASRKDEKSDMQGIMVSVIAQKKKYALFVNDVLGVQKVVLKDFSVREMYPTFYSSSAIMGDGTAAMALDLDCLIQNAIKT